MKILKILALIPALMMGASASADSKKTLTLSVGTSQLFLKQKPMLSLSNGPLAGNETSIDVELDTKAFSKLFANKIIEQGNVIYREARNFRNGQAEFKIRHVDGTVSTKTFSLAPNAPTEGILEPSEFLLSVGAAVTVDFDIYVCFKENNNCVFEKTSSDRLFAEGGGSAKYNFRPLVDCRSHGYFIRVEGSIEYPEIQRIILHRSVARRMLKVSEVITAKSKPVLTGADFAGFTTNIGEFGLYHDYNPGTTLEVTREKDKLSVLTRYPNGKFRSAYDFGGCRNLP
jgi:hypothetical protein